MTRLWLVRHSKYSGTWWETGSRTKIFHSIDITLSGIWELLLWNDSTNFGGVKGSLTIKEPEERDLDEEDAPDIIMSWNMATYLPEAGNIQANFNRVVVG